MNTQRLTLDLDKSSVPRGRVTIAQCDHDGTTVEAEIYDNGIALDTSGLSAYLVMRLPDGRHYYRVPATLDGHVATALVDEAYAATATGTTEIAYFELVGSGGVVYSTSRFGVRVLPSATAGATVPETWDGEVERLIQQLDDAIETATDAANVANAAAANADATADGVESRVQEMAQDAAETATADAEHRIQDAIDAMGDISELAVPLMSADIRGGAKLEEHGGLVLRDEKLGIGSLVQESDGYVRGGLAEVTAKGHAEQDGTPTPDSPVEIQVVRGRNLLQNTASSTTINGVTFTVNVDGSITANGTATSNVLMYFTDIFALDGTYTFSGDPGGTSINAIRIYSQPSGEVIGRKSAPTFTYTGNANAAIYFPSGEIVSNITFYPQLELGSTPQPYVPYGHVGLEVQGRNLLANTATSQTINGVTFTVNADGSVTCNGTATAIAQFWVNDTARLTQTGSFILSGCPAGGSSSTYDLRTDSSTSSGTAIDWGSGQTFSRTDGLSGTAVVITIRSGYTCNNLTFYPQLELGSTATEYEPYYHTATPIPLPSRGWVGSLPDGTADVLTLDGAGHVEWELADAETTTAATDGITGTVGTDVLSTTGQIADGATVLYKLATPVTEDLGYIDPPSINGDGQISIPELDELGVRYFVDDSAGTLARQWYERAQSEYEGRILALEQAVAELATA